MTVKELIEELEDLRGDAPVQVVQNGKGADIATEIAYVGYYDNDTDWVQIELSEVRRRIGGDR